LPENPLESDMAPQFHLADISYRGAMADKSDPRCPVREEPHYGLAPAGCICWSRVSRIAALAIAG
jgi:hypothetical protein